MKKGVTLTANASIPSTINHVSAQFISNNPHPVTTAYVPHHRRTPTTAHQTVHQRNFTPAQHNVVKKHSTVKVVLPATPSTPGINHSHDLIHKGRLFRKKH